MLLASKKSMPLAAVLATVALAAATYPQRAHGDSIGSQQSDSRQSPADKATAARVHAALNADPNDYYRRVTIIAKDGVVTPGGFVWSTEGQYMAKQIAGGVQGVTKVVDKMQMQPKGYEGGGDS